jgi:hypothetical protein
MAYTNKTTNYELPQYVSTDKPTYLVDFNKAMRTIDSTMKTNATNIETNATNITVASNKVGDLSTLETTAKTDAVSAINEVNTKVDNNEQYFNIDTYTTISKNDMTMSDPLVTIANGSSLTLATNSDSTLFKLYGKIDVNTNGYENDLSLSFSTSLRPTTAISINNAYLGIFYHTDGHIYSIQSLPIAIATDGTVTISLGHQDILLLQSCILQPCLYFLKDFGD